MYEVESLAVQLFSVTAGLSKERKSPYPSHGLYERYLVAIDGLFKGKR
ncbi:hypothetical protein [Paenibacillus odorifer]|nr:hypothetical protein [Paenibacillus odorifer]